ncbi:MAG: hypothetical protein HC939_00855 [Pleurocapsa sp. SU_5_0]|nr:hypothetical protein [Pleurocapsa sp. SU_5_0]NJO97884.1 hypothetical protein [Pleurocapsa sp. CRU_1_2]NJR44552.1 hypothetical protein [Hyellaceae cyanobacterium CSU_1_1]
MLDNYKSVPFLAGISILLITSVSIGAFVYSSLRADSTDTAGESKTETDSLGGTSTDKTKSAPFPSVESSGAGSNTDSTTGIPTGTYSNPPTTIETGSEDLVPKTSQSPINNFESSVDRNRAIQQTMNDSIDHSIPDYSAPASSNNYQDTQDNSLIEPLEDDSLLESSQSNPDTVPLTPATEPLSPSSSSPLSQP